MTIAPLINDFIFLFNNVGAGDEILNIKIKNVKAIFMSFVIA